MNRDFKRGFKAGSTIVPTFVAIFIGLGVAASLLHIPALATLLSTVAIFAAPAQFAMVDVAAHSSALVQIVSVGVLVNLRFFVMSMTLSTLFAHVPKRRLAIWAQFVTASSYLVTFFESRRATDGSQDLFDFYRGVVAAAFPAAVIGTVLGVWFGTGLPPVFNFAATLFLPVYFTLLITSEQKSRNETLAVMLGFLVTPLFEAVVPGWGLFIVALSVGALLEARGGD